MPVFVGNGTFASSQRSSQPHEPVSRQHDKEDLQRILDYFTQSRLAPFYPDMPGTVKGLHPVLLLLATTKIF